MASTMEVDTMSSAQLADGKGTNPLDSQNQEKMIKIHPLAIIGISDHHTRIISGGSVQNPDSLVMGLLFGYEEGMTTSIIDAEEVEYPKEKISSSGKTESANDQVIKTMINLHQKVFPTHQVVGWYRISGSEYSGEKGSGDTDGLLPNPQDMVISNTFMKEYSENPLFLLMNVASGESNEIEVNNSGSDQTMKAEPEDAREKMDQDEHLPLCVFETVTISANQKKSVFVNLEFELETFEPERIAVEKVFKTQPAFAVSSSNVSSSKKEAAGESGQEAASNKVPAEKTNNKTNNVVSSQPQSAAVSHLESLRSSVEAMNIRVAVLLEFLKKTHQGDIPPDHALLRQVSSLVKQLPFVMGRGDFVSSPHQSMRNGQLKEQFESGYDEMLTTSYLASIAETTTAVLSYSKKFRVANDNSNRESSGRRKMR